MSRRAVIVGVGQTPLGKFEQATSLGLQAQAATAALNDAGLPWAAIDGLITTPLGLAATLMPSGVLAAYVNLRPRYQATVDLAGASGAAMIRQAAMAVEAGEAEVVLCAAGAGLRSYGRETDVIRHMAETGAAHPQFEMPYGPTLVALYALLAARHFHEFGTNEEDLARVAVLHRVHAARNPLAYKRDPLDLSAAIDAPIISTPLRLFDCSVVCDGAAAAIVTTEERARDLEAQSVFVRGWGQGFSHAHLLDHPHPYNTGAAAAGRDAFGRAGLTSDAIDVALLYDCFTIAVLIELEDIGFCERGEAASAIASGQFALDGRCPLNPHGGLLSGGHPGLSGGFLHVVEAVNQLRGQASGRQVAGARHAFVHGNGGVAGIHASLVLTNDD